MLLLNKESFSRSIPVVAFRVTASSVGLLRSKLQKNEILAIPKIKSIVNDAEDCSKRLLLLSVDVKGISEIPFGNFPEIHVDEDSLNEASLRAMKEFKAELVPYTVKVGFEEMNTHEILKSLLPSEMDIPSSFETAGHIAHVNLRDEHEPFKNLIGEVILEKNPHVRTVVNKVGTIDSTFRFFNMEVIAGEPSTVVEVHEGGCRFKFDYAKVYWNSRLQAEHLRLVEEFKSNDVVCDMFAGVGPFALPAAKKGCRVYANDLNPVSVEWLKYNARKNKVEDNIKIYNQDAREFVSELVASTQAGLDHFIMNLPASAHEFLNVFRDVSSTELLERATIYCYIFCKTTEDPLEKIESGLGHPINRELAKVRRVRDVAPNKEMFCVSFKLPDSLLSNGKRPRTD